MDARPPPPAADELIDTARLASFSDNVISIAITLLVLDVRVPAGLGTLAVGQVLRLLAPRLLAFVLSFAIVGVYWVGHHLMIRRAVSLPRSTLWANNLFLLLITLVPASAALLGGYPGQRASAQLYGANLGLVAGALLLVWDGIVRFHRRHGLPLDPAHVRLAYRRMAVGIGISALGIGLAALSPWASYGVYCLTPVLYIVMQLLTVGDGHPPA